MPVSWSTSLKYDRFPAERCYTYIGDKLTDSTYRGQNCKAVLRPDLKCIRGRNSNMLVEFNGVKVVVLAKRLRAIH